MTTPLRQRIEHLVVVMLENRSFDHLLGYLDHPSKGYERLSSDHSNLEDPFDPGSRPWPATPDGRPYAPLDPDHSHDAVMLQLGLVNGGATPNSGFVASYLAKAGLARVIAARKAGLELGSVVMGCLQEGQIPALSCLAKEFAVCTRWFSSVPGETWPNRNFLHAATSDNAVNIELGLYTDPTIFELLEKAAGNDDRGQRRAWRIYHDGPAQVMAFRNLWDDERIRNWDGVVQFRRDAEKGELARYSFIEPNHRSPGARLLNPASNSQHPGNNRVPVERYQFGGETYEADFRRGDVLIAQVYEALRRNEELFRKTLLLITYDEHGGWYDHVPPPLAVPPGDRVDRGFLRSLVGLFVRRGRHRFDFDRLGVRVPAVLVSPWIERGTIVGTTFEHASVPRTLREMFLPGLRPLSARDAAAASCGQLAGRDSPRSLEELPNLEKEAQAIDPAHLAVEETEVRDELPPDGFQRSLDALALIVGDNLERPVAALLADPLPTVAAVEEEPPPSIAEQAENAMRKFREKAESSR